MLLNKTGVLSTAVAVERPTVTLDAQWQPGMAQDLLEVDIFASTRAGTRCEMVLSNWNPTDPGNAYPYLGHPLIDFGKELQIMKGATVLFSGRISAWTAEYPQGTPPRIRVRAIDSLAFRARVLRSRHFENVATADIFKTLITENGLTSKVTGTYTRFETITQVQETDLDFLYRLAALVDAEILITGTLVAVKKPMLSSRASATLNYGANLQEFSATTDLASQAKKVKVSGWDPESKQRFDSESAAILPSVPAGARTGPSVLEGLGLGQPLSITNSPAKNDSEASSLANALFLSASRRFLKGKGIAQGSVLLRPGATVQIKGLGTPMNGMHSITECTFHFDLALGQRWEFYTERGYVCP